MITSTSVMLATIRIILSVGSKTVDARHLDARVQIPSPANTNNPAHISRISRNIMRRQLDIPTMYLRIAGKLNWGAFLWTFFWSISHNVWIGLICLVPYVGWIMSFVLLFKGNEMAWKSRRFESVEHFQSVQKAWTVWGIVILVGVLSFAMFLALVCAIIS